MVEVLFLRMKIFGYLVVSYEGLASLMFTGLFFCVTYAHIQDFVSLSSLHEEDLSLEARRMSAVLFVSVVGC